MAALTFDLRRAERTNGEAVCKKGKQAVLGASLGRCVSIMRSAVPVASEERTKIFTPLPSTKQSSQTHSFTRFIWLV